MRLKWEQERNITKVQTRNIHIHSKKIIEMLFKEMGFCYEVSQLCMYMYIFQSVSINFKKVYIIR